MIEKLEIDSRTSQINTNARILRKINEIIEDNQEYKLFVNSELRLIQEALEEYGINSQEKSSGNAVKGKDEPRPDILHVCKRTDEIRKQTLEEVEKDLFYIYEMIGEGTEPEDERKMKLKNAWLQLGQLLDKIKEMKND